MGQWLPEVLGACGDVLVIIAAYLRICRVLSGLQLKHRRSVGQTSYYRLAFSHIEGWTERSFQEITPFLSLLFANIDMNLLRLDINMYSSALSLEFALYRQPLRPKQTHSDVPTCLCARPCYLTRTNLRRFTAHMELVWCHSLLRTPQPVAAD